MKIVSITDIHGNTEAVDHLQKPLKDADLVLITGDITHLGGYDKAKNIIEYIKKYNANIMAVAGNCDKQGVDTYLTEQNINLHKNVKVINGISFVGIEGSLPCPGKTPKEYSEDTFAKYLQALSDKLPENKPSVLVSHQPPHNTFNDKLASGMHVGSRSIRQFIEDQQPLLCFCGHIHEAVHIDSIGNTLIVNPGQLKFEKYAFAQITDSKAIVDIKNA